MSILSFKERGPWGDARWRGNCSGMVYQSLFNQLKPKFVIDPMMGSGTSIEVAKEMGIPCVGLDLHSGFNILRHSILSAVGGQEADLVISHPPYHNIIKYSGEVWGSEAHPDDLSRCVDENDFCEKMHVALLNQREATLPGGYYATIIGDTRQQGKYVSYQAEFIARMPSNELASVLIKAQHNTQSGGRTYAAMKLPRIEHEYILLWAKPRAIMSMLQTLAVSAEQQQQRVKSTWRAIVRQAMVELGGTSDLTTLYQRVSSAKPEQLTSNQNWMAKIRQTLQLGPFVSSERGVWAIA